MVCGRLGWLLAYDTDGLRKHAFVSPWERRNDFGRTKPRAEDYSMSDAVRYTLDSPSCLYSNKACLDRACAVSVP